MVETSKDHYVKPSQKLQEIFAGIPVLKFGERPAAIIIGKFRLVRMPDGNGIWIGEAEGGEGGQFKEEAIEAAIAKFYSENF